MKLKTSLIVVLLSLGLIVVSCQSDIENDFEEDDGVTVEDENIIVIICV